MKQIWENFKLKMTLCELSFGSSLLLLLQTALIHNLTDLFITKLDCGPNGILYETNSGNVEIENDS